MVEQQLRARDIHDQRVLRVMEELPRHHFIPPKNKNQAYLDQPVPIGRGQTISQPYIVALMTEKLDVQPDHHVLEIGYGCGYQTAILARLARQVYSVELLEEIGLWGRQNVQELGVKNVQFHIGDGRQGWPASESPGQTEPIQFDRILVAAAARDVPAALKEQLKQGGKMVIPLGAAESQTLWLLEKQGSEFIETFLCYCRFVELV